MEIKIPIQFSPENDRDNFPSPKPTSSPPNNTLIGIINFCGVTNEFLGLETLISSHKVSHLHISILNAGIFLSQFSVHGKDRNSFGGGVFILIDKSIPSV